VEQNLTMKKELSATERRLNARNDRIYQLEQLVTGQEHKLNQREQRYNEELAALKRQVTLGTFLFSFLLPRSLSLSPLITTLSRTH
jgi:septal ring factor EnvC (AmiA/AmiB activator)